MEKIALITGINGQDGSYLSEILLEKNYKIYGIIRRHSNINTYRIDHIYSKLHISYGDMTDTSSLIGIITKIKDENKDMKRLEIYNLAAQSHVKVSFEIPEYTGNVDAMGTLKLLEAIRICGLCSIVRFYQASTSELYGKVLETPQSETTPFNPQSPYAIAKLYSYWMVKNYRDAYNMYACNGILFNHTSPRRGETFVTKKITMAIANIMKGKQEYITLGNINSKRDWCHSRDVCYGMWLMLQQDKPTDYVLSSGETYSIKSFLEIAFETVGITIKWEGEHENTVGYDEKTKKVLVKIDKKYFRPTEVELLLGDSSKARKELNWKNKIGFYELIKEMIEYDLKSI